MIREQPFEARFWDMATPIPSNVRYEVQVVGKAGYLVQLLL
jgi:hypothetical protein